MYMVDLLGCFGFLEEVYEFIKSMLLEFDVGIWGVLLGVCVVYSDVKLGQKVVDLFVEIVLDIGVY